MRLVRLRIRNIASLRGEHIINFEEFLQDSSLFAITGETGAGKSTILNCVGLALYGQVYKKNVNQLDVVTLGEKDGSIELIFQTRGVFYLAEWKARVKKHNGEPYSSPQPALRNLFKIEGRDFTSDREVTGENPAELLNLSFDQFCKCVILNQGEFAKFLTSTFNDRKDILEKLYPGEDLENMGRELRIELESLKQLKNETEIKLGELPTDKTAGENLEVERKSLEVTLTKLDSELTTIEELNRRFESLLSYFDKYHEALTKKNQMFHDLAQETTRFNLLLKTGESIQIRAEEAKQTQQRRLPKLQELLLREENLKNLNESSERLQKSQVTLSEEMNLLTHKKEKKTKENEVLMDRLHGLKKLISYPIDLLKNTRDLHAVIFDLFSEKELIEQKLQGKKEALEQLEKNGIDLRTAQETLLGELSHLPQDLSHQTHLAEERKLKNSLQIQEKNRALMRAEELHRQRIQIEEDNLKLNENLRELRILKESLRVELFPLEATLSLQEVLKARSVCVNHALSKGLAECPVCDGHVTLDRLQLLQKKYAQSDIQSIQQKFDETNEKLLKLDREEAIFESKKKRDEDRLFEIKVEVQSIQKGLSLEVISPELIDQEIEECKKKIWKRENLEKELQKINLELEKIRSQYLLQKNEIESLRKLLEKKTDSLIEISEKIKPLLPQITKDSIRKLGQETGHLNLYLELEAKTHLSLEELRQLEISDTKLNQDSSFINNELKGVLSQIKTLKEELNDNLKGERALEVIQRLNKEMQSAQDEWLKQLELQRRQEGLLKDSQGRLGQLEELLKDFDLQFVKELHILKAIAHEIDLPVLNFLKEIDLTFQSERELYLPIKDLLSKEREALKDRTNKCRVNLATVKANLVEWEKVQDRMSLLNLKLKELNEVLYRKERLFEVLGKDELRTFVLALVEENLILQTNEELQKLCQGRYEIVHQTKSLRMTPEFYILDKYREGGRRKVSTLSGGETFMVSLAMALGLAEMTRGQAEIDSLFIDEGFGTLDQESLEDVLNMLQQIQTRGLMVGIISHIKALTGAIPVNLNLKKRNDGTSALEVIHN
jgi:exonuclease SbcC